MIQARSASLSFGEQTVFNSVSFTIQASDRIGLMGRNGSGKTTLLKAIIDPSILDSGSIVIQGGMQVAYMPQEVILLSDRTVVEETLSGNKQLWSALVEAQEIEKKIALNPTATLVERYAALSETLQQLSPARATAQAKQMLSGLGFTQEQFDAPVSTLSVGWKMRIVLAKLLLQNADFYLFDEPTNHLDLKAKEWFLSFLKRSSFGFMIICHEKYFLDELCSSMLDIDRGTITRYSGSYSSVLVQKEQRREQLEAAYTQQQKEIEQKKAVIARFKAGTKAKMAHSMQRALDKMELISIPPEQRKASFSFGQLQQSGKDVLVLDSVAHAFGDRQLFKDVSLTVHRGAKIALVASNGVGKTTLLNLISKSLALQKGSITLGHNVRMAVFAQDQNKALDLSASIFDNVRRLSPKATDHEIRTFLGSFLFSGEDILKKVMVLSGGEKNRVGMVGVLLQHANLLLLDEPTNHLDIETKEILLSALQEYPGTILFVSHDRDFVNQLATDILELTPQGGYLYRGNYDSFQHQKSLATAHEPESHQTRTAVTQKPQQIDRNAQKRLAAVEKKIASAEQSIATLELSFTALAYGTPQYDQAVSKLERLKQELNQLESSWEQIFCSLDQ